MTSKYAARGAVLVALTIFVLWAGILAWMALSSYPYCETSVYDQGSGVWRCVTTAIAFEDAPQTPMAFGIFATVVVSLASIWWLGLRWMDLAFDASEWLGYEDDEEEDEEAPPESAAASAAAAAGEEESP